MKKNKIVIVVFAVIALSIIGFLCYMTFGSSKTTKHIETIAEKMYNAEEIYNFKIKKIQTSLYEGKDYNKTEINIYDLKNRIINFTTKKTEFLCVDDDCKDYESYESEKNEYRTFDGKFETSYVYDRFDEIWEKSSFEIGEHENLVGYEYMYDINIFTDIKEATLIDSQDGIEEYEVIVSKSNLYKYNISESGEIINDAKFRIQIKDNYIVRYETNVNEWYNYTYGDYTNVKNVYEIYDVNKSEIIIPTDIINNAKQN